MAHFSLARLFSAVTAIAVAICVLQSASRLMSQIVGAALWVAVAAITVCAVRCRGAQRAAHVGAVVCISGTILASWELPVPPQMYICALPYGTSVFYDIDGLWNIVHSILALILGYAGNRFAKFMYEQNQVEPCDNRWRLCRWLVGSAALVLAGIWLIDLSSPVVASTSQNAANAAFCLSIVGTIVRRKQHRAYWAMCAASLWAYLFLETCAAWPYSYFLGPAPYLYRYYESVSTSWVTAHALFGILFACYVGLLSEYCYGKMCSCETLLDYRSSNGVLRRCSASQVATESGKGHHR